jgi:integrase
VLLAHGHKVERPKGRAGQLSPNCQAWLAHIDLHWHGLRRECGSRWYEELDNNVLVVMQALGHRSLKTTQKYLHLGEHGFDDAFRRVFAAKNSNKRAQKLPQNSHKRV